MPISLGNVDHDGDDDHGMWDDEYDENEDEYDEDEDEYNKDEYYEDEYDKDELEMKKLWHANIDKLSDTKKEFLAKQLLVSVIVVLTSRLL